MISTLIVDTLYCLTGAVAGHFPPPVNATGSTRGSDIKQHVLTSRAVLVHHGLRY